MQSDRSQPLINIRAEGEYPTLNQAPRLEPYKNQVYQPQANLNGGWNNIGNQGQVNQINPVNQVNHVNNLNQGWNNQGQQPPIQGSMGMNQMQGVQYNQGYPPSYSPNYGMQPQMNHPQMMQPQMNQQPLMGQIKPNLNQQKIIIVREHSSVPCRMCGFDGMSTWRQTAGCTAYSWCVCLFIFTGIFGFWVPFCVDSCYDTEVLCSRCAHIKAIVPASCC